MVTSTGEDVKKLHHLHEIPGCKTVCLLWKTTVSSTMIKTQNYHRTQQFHSWVYIQETGKHTHTNTSVQSSIIHISQKL